MLEDLVEQADVVHAQEQFDHRRADELMRVAWGRSGFAATRRNGKRERVSTRARRAVQGGTREPSVLVDFHRGRFDRLRYAEKTAAKARGDEGTENIAG